MSSVISKPKASASPPSPPPAPPPAVDPAVAIAVGGEDGGPKTGSTPKRRGRGAKYNPVLTGSAGDTSAATVTRKGLLGE